MFYFYFMKFIPIFILGITLSAQTTNFPKSWEGIWKGKLDIYNSNNEKPTMTIPMQLVIQPKNDSVSSWEIHYMVEKPDVRKYELIRDGKDNSWKIDEKNGIVLPQTFLNGRMTSSFSVEKNLLIASYWLENNQMNFEIIVTQTSPEKTAGLGNEESPTIGIHPLSSYHKAELYRE